jgi:hypothetical protein
MSDDEDDYYEYDEFEDDGIFWVEEADPTAAVCLVLHAP